MHKANFLVKVILLQRLSKANPTGWRPAAYFLHTTAGSNKSNIKEKT